MMLMCMFESQQILFNICKYFKVCCVHAFWWDALILDWIINLGLNVERCDVNLIHGHQIVKISGIKAIVSKVFHSNLYCQKVRLIRGLFVLLIGLHDITKTRRSSQTRGERILPHQYGIVFLGDKMFWCGEVNCDWHYYLKIYLLLESEKTWTCMIHLLYIFWFFVE